MKLELLKTCGGLCGWFLHCDRNLHFPCLKVEVATRANGVREKGVEKEGVASPVTLPLFQRLNQRHHPFQHPSHLINTFNQHASVQRPLHRCELIIPYFLGFTIHPFLVLKKKKKWNAAPTPSFSAKIPVLEVCPWFGYLLQLGPSVLTWAFSIPFSIRWPHLTVLNSTPLPCSLNRPHFNDSYSSLQHPQFTFFFRSLRFSPVFLLHCSPVFVALILVDPRFIIFAPIRLYSIGRFQHLRVTSLFLTERQWNRVNSHQTHQAKAYARMNTPLHVDQLPWHIFTSSFFSRVF